MGRYSKWLKGYKSYICESREQELGKDWGVFSVSLFSEFSTELCL